jgi:hypothetical protein
VLRLKIGRNACIDAKIRGPRANAWEISKIYEPTDVFLGCHRFSFYEQFATERYVSADAGDATHGVCEGRASAVAAAPAITAAPAIAASPRSPALLPRAARQW